ncbi:hypothetical protein Ancab_018601 [Ancistrocladus abbreviatus]
MHNIYTSTSIISFRTKASQSYSFNDYSYILNGRCPSCCCTCCASYPINTASSRLYSINPSLIYGLRQSTLIQWAPSRRLILRGAGDRCSCRLPIHDVGRICYGESCCIRGKSDAKIGRKKGNGRYSFRVFKERFEMGQAGANADAEAILSLLTEDVSEECLDIRGRKGRELKKGKFVKRENGVIERGKVRRDNVASGYMGSDLKHQLQSVNFQSREEFCRREDREDFLKGEEQRSRRGGSSSSYYSLSDSGDFESGKEVEAKHEEFLGESLKDSRKRSGVVISEVVEEESQKFNDGRHKRLGLKRHDGTKVGSSAEWDWRKKSEKKLSEESVHESTSRDDSVSSQSQLSLVHERSSAKTSTSKAQSSYEEQQSMSNVNLRKESRSHSVQMENQVSGHSKSSEYNRSVETSHNETSGNDATISSSSRRILEGREENAIISGYCKTCGQVTGEDNLRRHSQHRVELSEIRETNRIRTSTVERQSESRIKQQEEKSSSLESSVMQETEQHLQDTYVASGQVNTRRNSQLYGEVAYDSGSYTENASNSQVRLETRMKHLEENSDSLMSRQDAGQQCQSGVTVISQNESRSKDVKGASLVQLGEMETITTSESSSEQRLYYEDSYLTSKVKSVEQLTEKQEQIDVQTGVRNQLQRPIKQASFHESLSGEATHVSSFVGLSSQTQVQQAGEEEDKRISQFLMMPPPSQLVERDPAYVGPASRLARQDSSRTSEAGSSSLYADVLSGTPSSHDEVSGYRRIEHEDALGSAERMETSSIQILGEFVEKIRHEASTSGMQKEKFSEAESAQEVKKHVQGELTQLDSRSTHLKKQDPRRSSGDSGTKGPSDEMWHVRDPSIQETPEMEASEGITTSGNSVVRSGRSFWNVIGDVFRLRWGTQAEARKSTIKSGGQGSSNESADSEARFSGHDPDEASNVSQKRDKTSMPQATAGQLILRGPASQSQREGGGLVSSEDKLKHVDVSLSSSILESKSGSGGISGEATVDRNVYQQSSQATSSVALQLPAARQTGTHGTEEISEVARAEVFGGATGEQTEHRIDLRVPQVSDSERNDGELRRRKLQRATQVVKERFDKWEEAYRHESEQRKIDEMFMREALLEAKKAADVWEVPVGAILVQNGKIIARGYNLVEELRDSTAHAEMICIREASNILRTWRLSGTTLYVTLEPCPMCAGAILQARIDTLVWGAPNKLLGADGSWIRLFPSGSEEENGSEPTDMPAAPVHPFHPKMTIRRGVLEAQCADTMQQFFQLRRKKQKKIEPPAQPSCLPVPHHPSKLFHKMHDAFHLMFCL